MEIPRDLCDSLARACGGAYPDNWVTWCRSECVPLYARTIPCSLNADCVLCDEPRADGRTIVFGLPADELEYMWTLTDPEDEPVHPPSEPSPTGTRFADREADWQASAPWHAYEPFPGLDPTAATGFCEPGPNRFVSDFVVPTTSALVLEAQRMTLAPSFDAVYCPMGRCESGPYVACAAQPTACQYAEPPHTSGLGFSSQADRTATDGARATYGFGRYRAILRASGETSAPEPGFVYAFFTQDNEPCVDGQPNLDTNTSEIDVELSSGPGDVDDGVPWCTPDQMCFEVSTWVSSTEGIPMSAGILRHEVSGFRYRDRATAGMPRTYGFDWQIDDVRFTYDRDPSDCDEQAEGCTASRGSLALCRHTRFVPRRPAPLHVQLWNAWWAGDVPRGTTAQMTVPRVWHDPS